MTSGASILNPGRRDPVVYRFAPQAFEEHLTRDPAYRKLRFYHDREERRLTDLQQTHAPEYRIQASQKLLQSRKMELLQYLLAHRPKDDAEVPVELIRHFDADGTLVEEMEREIPGYVSPYIQAGDVLGPVVSGSEPLSTEQLAEVLGEDATTEATIAALGGVPAAEVMP